MNYLTFSIFYNQNEWFKLLNHLQSFKYLDDIKITFFLRLSYERGPHIQFTIKVDKSNRRKYALYFSKYINDFLIKNYSSNKNLETIPHKLFKDFTNNSLHYGVDDYFNLSKKDQSINYYSQITEIIFLIYEEYQEDAIESLTEIMIQVFAISSLASNISIDSLIIIFEQLLKKESAKYNEESLKNQQKVNSGDFNDNKELIVEYLKEILIDKTNTPIQGWEKKVYDLVLSSSIKNIDKQVAIDICENINYNSNSAHDMFLKSLKELKLFRN
ncbi:MAG: hypothetical protein ABJK28_10690 [Algibacter sp.]